MSSETRKVVLINPPFLDPTLPPHFAAYLTGALKEIGAKFDLKFLDLNIELLRSIAEERYFQLFTEAFRCRIEEIEAKFVLSGLEQLALHDFRRCHDLSLKDIREALAVFSNEQFYSFPMYQRAVRILTFYVGGIAALGLPGVFTFWDSKHRQYSNLSYEEDVLSEQLHSAFWEPFSKPLQEIISAGLEGGADIVGISCNYEAQLIFTILLAKFLQKNHAKTKLVVGGTELTSLYKNSADKSIIWRMLGKETICVIGEGESAFAEIMTGSGEAYKHPNIITFGAQHAVVSSAAIEDVNQIGSPDYTIFNLKSYLSPEPVIMYSPTRGCYWNKCTFCDYGLNFGRPTSPSRNRDLNDALQELRTIKQHSDVVYFAVDAIAPSYLRKLSEGLDSLQLGLHWSAEIRLEPSISTRELSQGLRRGGCVALSFGFETGSQRILDAIKKGINLANVPSLLKELTSNTIAVQLMGFLGFPGETIEDVEATLDFLRANRSAFLFLGLGDFVLTPGAIVAKRPDDFGITQVSAGGADIARSLTWKDSNGRVQDGSGHCDHTVAISREFRVSPLSRPFVGGIDTAHSLLYIRRYSSADLRKILSLPMLGFSKKRSFTSSFAEFPDFAVDGFPFQSNGARFKANMARLSERRAIKKGEVTVFVSDLGNFYSDSRHERVNWIEEALV